VEDLLVVGVVGGAERVGAQPLHQVEVLHHQRPVEAFTADLPRTQRASSLASDPKLFNYLELTLFICFLTLQDPLSCTGWIVGGRRCKKMGNCHIRI
jgi:hypothetical protein